VSRRDTPGQAGAPQARLLELFAGHRLTPTQRRIARCLVENAATAAFLSSSELAELTGVSQPSVTRFAMALGYDGFPDLRRHLRELHLGDSRSEDGANAYQHAVAAEMANLEGLAAALQDPGPVQRADVRVATGEDDLEQARAAGGSAVLAVMLPRYPRQAIDLLGACKDLGFTTVTITDAPIGPAVPLSDILLSAPVSTDLMFDSQAAPMVLAAVLLQAMCDVSPHGPDRLEQFETSAERRRLFVP
jgi:DNA-binding MurR/RpiR family transcriptional regulator